MDIKLKNKVAIITGGAGALGGIMAMGLAKQGTKVAILGRTEKTIQIIVDEIKTAGGEAIGLVADVLNRNELEVARDKVIDKWGSLDILVNAAGGNMKGATIMPEESFFDMNMDDFDAVTKLNLKGTILPTIVFGEQMALQQKGSIVNISSMAAQQALTRVVGYSTSKASIDIFTKWLAVEMAQKHSEKIRVNAIAPGFFIGKQNRALLLNNDGSLTTRGETIVKNTPMKRFGKAEELLSTLYWLCDDDSSFITGIVVPVDGGFSAFSGV
ncbi:MAG: SDR family oxidoreductase [Flavobacteriaceae bacterium]|nr:SDR family oxidoreductase [Flavobacteriaceae bacterium]